MRGEVGEIEDRERGPERPFLPAGRPLGHCHGAAGRKAVRRQLRAERGAGDSPLPWAASPGGWRLARVIGLIPPSAPSPQARPFQLHTLGMGTTGRGWQDWGTSGCCRLLPKHPALAQGWVLGTGLSWHTQSCSCSPGWGLCGGGDAHGSAAPYPTAQLLPRAKPLSPGEREGR